MNLQNDKYFKYKYLIQLETRWDRCAGFLYFDEKCKLVKSTLLSDNNQYEKIFTVGKTFKEIFELVQNSKLEFFFIHGDDANKIFKKIDELRDEIFNLKIERKYNKEKLNKAIHRTKHYKQQIDKLNNSISHIESQIQERENLIITLNNNLSEFNYSL